MIDNRIKEITLIYLYFVGDTIYIKISFTLISISMDYISQASHAFLENMEAAKDLLKRAVELDKSEKYSEALICYEEGIQNLLRAMEGR